MATSATSRSTLADVNVLISNSDLPTRAKADYRSAVNSVCRILGAPSAQISAEPAALRRRLEGVAPAAHGMSPGRWSNVRSLLGKALALMGPVMPSRSASPVLPAWNQLLEILPRNRRDSLLALARHLSAQGIEPAQVRLSDLEAYQQAIVNDRLRAGPERTWDGIVWTWNVCQREVQGWPDVEIPRAPRRVTYVRPWTDFPVSMQAEVERFLDRQSGRDLSEDGPPRPLREASLKTREYQLRVAASVLVDAGVPTEDLQSLSDVLTLDRFKLLLRALLDRRGGQTSTQIGQIASFLTSVARHWLKVDDETLAQMRKLTSRVAVNQKGMTAKNRERLRPFNDDETVERLQRLPEGLRGQIDRSKQAPARKAIEAQKAAAIAILLVVPLRLKNLVGLDVDEHLIERDGRLYLVIPEQQVKNAHLIDFELPEDVAELLAWYVREHRPLLLQTPSTALFPGEGGGPKSAQTLASQIKKTVFKHTGLTVNTHLFRHIAAKVFLDRNPGDYVTVQRVLGHRSIATTTSIYTGMETRAAGRHFVDVVRRRQSGAGV
jgi:site-specific recombinase XerD